MSPQPNPVKPLQCFVIMPYQGAFDAVFETIRSVAARALPGEGVDCYWLKDDHAAGRITDKIVESLNDSIIHPLAKGKRVPSPRRRAQGRLSNHSKTSRNCFL